MSKLNAKGIAILKMRIAGLLDCTDLREMDFCQQMLDLLNSHGVNADISDKRMKWLQALFVKHNIRHPSDFHI